MGKTRGGDPLTTAEELRAATAAAHAATKDLRAALKEARALLTDDIERQMRERILAVTQEHARGLQDSYEEGLRDIDRRCTEDLKGALARLRKTMDKVRDAVPATINQQLREMFDQAVTFRPATDVLPGSVQVTELIGEVVGQEIRNQEIRK